MRIAFVTGGLSPGRDGVGDYTQALARECRTQGHETRAIALADSYVDGVVEEEMGGIPRLRLSGATDWGPRVDRVRRFLGDFEADWVSYQFVLYAYNARGLPAGIGGKLLSLSPGSRRQIFFHEIWLAAERFASLKHRVFGFLQRRIILDLVRRLQPRVIQTSNPAYAHSLRRNGVDCSILPLFGQIPLATEPGDDWIGRLLKESVGETPREGVWIFAIFGTLHPVWPPEPLFTLLKEAGRLHERKIVVASIGNIGSGENLWSTFPDVAPDIVFIRFGERTEREVSQLLSYVDFGIATSPWELIGKSASVAVMLDHGLPVIVNRDDIRFDRSAPEFHNPLLERMMADLPSRLGELKRRPPASRLGETTATFLSALSAAAGTG